VEDLTPKHIVITGATSGIGTAAAQEMAKRGWRVTIVGRDQARLSAALSGVPGSTGLLADFTSLAEVRALASQLKGQRIDVLANNAGLVTRGTTVDGYDATMQINHLAPFLLTNLLRPELAPGARIVTTSSMASQTGGDPTPPGRRFASAWIAYGTSKKANIYFAAEASRRWPGLLSFSFHPGVVRTRFGTPLARIFYNFAPGLSTPEQGADQLVWLSTAPPEDLVNGAFYVSRKIAAGPSKNEAAASRLWEATATLVGLA
jgi:daunorubicin C-13 ketoreductase